MIPKILVATLLIALSALFTVPSIPQANAGTSLVCITTVGSKCSTKASVQFTGTVGSQLTIWVAIHSSLINGFDIIVIVDHTILSPTSADYVSANFTTGIFSPAGPHPGSVFKYCVAGVDVGGGGCTPQDNQDTVHLGLTSVGTGLTGHHTVGQLFSITYNIVKLPPSPIPVAFQTGCSTTSVAGTMVCALITNGSTSPVSASAIDATFV